MDRSPDDLAAERAALEQEREDLRAEQAAWLQEQAEWESVRSQVEGGLSNLESRLLAQAKRLRCPRGSEEFEAALQEQLRLAVERHEAAEKRLADSEQRRAELVDDLQEARRPTGPVDEEVSRLLEALDTVKAERRDLRDEIETLKQELSDAANAAPDPSVVSDLQSALETAQQERDAALADLAATAATEDDLIQLRDQHQRLNDELSAERDQTASVTDQLAETQQRLAEANERVEQLGGLPAEIDELRATHAASVADWEAREEAWRSQLADATAREEKLAAQAIDTEKMRAELAALRKNQTTSLLSQRERVAALESELSAWDEDRSDLEKQLDEQREENQRLTAQLAEAAAQRDELAATRSESDAEAVKTLEDRLAQTQRELSEQAAARATENGELERLRRERSELFRELDHATARVSDLKTAEDELAELRADRERVDGELRDALARLASADATESDTLSELRADRDRLTEQLDLAEQRLANADDLQGKFDLAIADLQAHREHVASLEDELAARPAAEAADHHLLQQLTEERDSLLRQLEETTPAVEPSEELDDLRRRFEMAVDDVRQLKEENHELTERLAAQGDGGAAPTGDGWEAQKQRLLASLEGDGEAVTEERREEVASIQGTIQITDNLIAEKDREIERLLAALGSGPLSEPAIDAEASVASDERLDQERERLAALENELRDKLRAAELELSVERAKISRAQNELEEQLLEIETLRAANGLAKDIADGVAPRRRWLDKLGLGGEGQ